MDTTPSSNLVNVTSRKLHHTVVKAAARFDAYFMDTETGTFRFGRLDDPTLISNIEFDTTAEGLEALRNGDVTWEEPEAEERPYSGRCGVMAAGYHARYSANPHGPGCNDSLDCTMRDVFLTKTRTITTKTGKTREEPALDVDALREFGQGLGLWNNRWDALNQGMMRMNLANRIRGYLRNHPEATITIGADTGRFGVESKSAELKKAA